MTQHIHSVTAAVDNGAGGLPERLAFANTNRLVPEFGRLGCVLLFEAGGRDAVVKTIARIRCAHLVRGRSLQQDDNFLASIVRIWLRNNESVT